MSIDAAVVDSICVRALNILTENGVGVFTRPSATISGTLQLIRSGQIAYLPPKQLAEVREVECLKARHCPGARHRAREGSPEPGLTTDRAYLHAKTVSKEERA
jgi:predicted Fe-Mo cluster-binding NifX family protein